MVRSMFVVHLPASDYCLVEIPRGPVTLPKVPYFPLAVGQSNRRCQRRRRTTLPAPSPSPPRWSAPKTSDATVALSHTCTLGGDPAWRGPYEEYAAALSRPPCTCLPMLCPIYSEACQ